MHTKNQIGRAPTDFQVSTETREGAYQAWVRECRVRQADLETSNVSKRVTEGRIGRTTIFLSGQVGDKMRSETLISELRHYSNYEAGNFLKVF